MATMKQQLDGAACQLVYDPERRELYVEAGDERLTIDEVLQVKGRGAEQLHMLIVDIFKGHDTDA